MGLWGFGMSRRYRPLFAVAALAMVLLGAGSVYLGQSRDVGAQAPLPYPFVIEVSDIGFNPRQCTINRNAGSNEVVFRNVSNKPIRVVKSPPYFGLDPTFDQTLAPGETSNAQSFTLGGNNSYEKADNPAHFVTISTPQYSNGGPIACSKETPTPTPTNTPTRTPTRAATPTVIPTPTPYPPPPACWARGCAVAVGVASDGE